MKYSYDIIIIGSGAGGGTVAERLIPLAEKGARIAIIESGPNYPREYFTQREIEMMGLLRNNGAWPTEDGAITLAAGNAVGGSTLMYTGVTFRIPDEVLHQWNIPGITPEDLKPRFKRLWKELNVIEPGPDMINDNNRLFREGCEKLGWRVEKINLNLKNCSQEGFCNLGCSSGGKQGTAEIQIPNALRSGIELISNCTIERISDGKAFGYIAKTPAGTKGGPLPDGEVEFAAKKIVLACGSPCSPALLLRSGFGKEFPALGRYIALHPAQTVYGIYRETIKNYRGFPKTYYTPQFTDSNHHYIETAFYYPFVSTKHLGLWGRDLRETMKSYDKLMCMIILNHDTAVPENRVLLDKKGNAKIRYRLSPESVKSLCHAQAQAARIMFAAGCEKAIMPCADHPVFSKSDVQDSMLEEYISPSNYLPIKVPVASAHPQGGCRMGRSNSDSVTDSYGMVHGYPWLYVADASIFPESSHVNPYLTVMALADRISDNLIKAINDL